MKRKLHNAQPSKLYRRYTGSKYQFPTHIIAGSGNVKGKLVVGSEAALQNIEQKIGRKLIVVKTNHTRSQWVFLEEKGTQRSQKFSKK